VRRETVRARTLTLDVDGWPGHRAGQHVDVRLTAADGYQAQRSYSIASPPGAPLEITVERLSEGEVSLWLVDEARPEDVFDIRGPIGGYFVWEPSRGGPLLLVGGGSGLVPLMCIERHRRRAAPAIDSTLLLSAEVAPPPDARPRCFVCGPTAFVEHVAQDLVDLGHHRALVKTERFGASG
jgi:ferredoxin-NADP reductase